MQRQSCRLGVNLFVFFVFFISNSANKRIRKFLSPCQSSFGYKGKGSKVCLHVFGSAPVCGKGPVKEMMSRESASVWTDGCKFKNENVGMWN